jgi:hypothetical protein
MSREHQILLEIPINTDSTILNDMSLTWYIDRRGDPNNLIYDPDSISNDIINNMFYNSGIYHIPVTISNNLSFIRVEIDETHDVSEEERDCCICMEQREVEEICRLNCSHTFCSSCVSTSIQVYKSRQQPITCSLCRTNIERIVVKTQDNKDKIQQVL